MKFRLKAFGLHLSGSASALTLVLSTLYLGWYRWPGWYLTSVLHVAAILVVVDVVLGPTLTLIVANPGKRRRALARDIAVIVTLQLAALAYGGVTLWLGRPLYYTFSV
ncbi:MAG: TfpX/TfpZ family type IV pilin accessory protein, partial [Steroidobacteraceae bacterium]